VRRKLFSLLTLTLIATLFFCMGAYGSSPIKLIINGKELKPDISPQIIDGRTMVPIRFVAEALGLDVKWDAANNAVVITNSAAAQQPQDSHQSLLFEPNWGLSRNNPAPMGKTVLTPDGFGVELKSFIDGEKTWEIAYQANKSNPPPQSGYKYIFIEVAVKNFASQKEPAYISEYDFSLVGSSNAVLYKPSQKSLVQPDTGPFKKIHGELHHGGLLSGALNFYVPANETDFVLIWNKSLDYDNKRFFEIK